MLAWNLLLHRDKWHGLPLVSQSFAGQLGMDAAHHALRRSKGFRAAADPQCPSALGSRSPAFHAVTVLLRPSHPPRCGRRRSRPAARRPSPPLRRSRPTGAPPAARSAIPACSPLPGRQAFTVSLRAGRSTTGLFSAALELHQQDVGGSGALVLAGVGLSFVPGGLAGGGRSLRDLAVRGRELRLPGAGDAVTDVGRM